MSSGAGAQESFCWRQIVKKKNRGVSEPKGNKTTTLQSCGVNKSVFVCVFFKLLGLWSYQYFFLVCFLQNGRSLGIALHCLYECSICRGTLFFHQFGEKLGDWQLCKMCSSLNATGRNGIGGLSNTSEINICQFHGQFVVFEVNCRSICKVQCTIQNVGTVNITQMSFKSTRNRRLMSQWIKITEYSRTGRGDVGLIVQHG